MPAPALTRSLRFQTCAALLAALLCIVGTERTRPDPSAAMGGDVLAAWVAEGPAGMRVIDAPPRPLDNRTYWHVVVWRGERPDGWEWGPWVFPAVTYRPTAESGVGRESDQRELVWGESLGEVVASWHAARFPHIRPTAAEMLRGGTRVVITPRSLAYNALVTLAWVSVAALILCAVRAVRDVRRSARTGARQARGLCPGCGYPRAGLGSPTCPECGQRLPPRPKGL